MLGENSIQCSRIIRVRRDFHTIRVEVGGQVQAVAAGSERRLYSGGGASMITDSIKGN